MGGVTSLRSACLPCCGSNAQSALDLSFIGTLRLLLFLTSHICTIHITTMPFHNIFSKNNKKTCRGTSRIHRTVSRVLKKFRIRRTRIDMYQETRRLHKSSECMIEETMTTRVPMLDGEYDFSAGAGGHSTIVRRSNQIHRPSFMTGDNTQDSFTPSPPFGPIDASTSNAEATSYRGSSMPLHLSTDPTSQSSSARDSRFSGLAQPLLQQKGTSPKTSTWPSINRSSLPHIDTRMAQSSLGDSSSCI